MKHILSISFLLCLFSLSSGQSFKLDKAQKAMDELNYTEAIKLYTEVLKDSDDATAKINLAHAYRFKNDYENAAYWYGQAVRLPQSESLNKLYYGQMLQTIGNCEDAKNWFEQFSSENPGDHRGQLLKQSCDKRQSLLHVNDGLFEVKSIDINTGSDDFGATFYDEGLIFSSDRDKGAAVDRVHTWTGNPFLELYYVPLEQTKSKTDQVLGCSDYNFKKVEKFNKDVNTKFHDAQITITKDGTRMLFTRNNWIDGKVGKSEQEIIKLKIYESQKSGDEWGDPVSLPFNSDEYNVTHPAITPDGSRLYFSSDMPGGFGGMDLYVSNFDNGRWGPPFNLGPLINTEGNELFPFYGGDEKLYFSSNGQIGLGGLDLYYIQDLGDNQWGDVTNLGGPINSTYDDFAMSFKNDKMTEGFFSSNRKSGMGGDDIYCFVKNAKPVEIYVYDQITSQALEGAKLRNSCNGQEYTSNNDGLILLELPLDSCCTFIVSKEAYNESNEKHCTQSVGSRIEIGLQKSFDCYVKGHVFDQNTGKPLENVKMNILSTCSSNSETKSYTMTDSLGYYYLDIPADCCYTITGEYDNYMMNPMSEQCSDCVNEATMHVVDVFMRPTTIASHSDRADRNNDITLTNRVGEDPSNTLIAGDPMDNENPIYQTKIVKDPNTGLYVNDYTGEPANLENPEGISYVEGVMMFNGREVKSNQTDEIGFAVSPSSDNFEQGEPIPFLLHIYYDFDKSNIRDEAEIELMKLCRMMRQNPELMVEVCSHTDARGSRKYNERLSQRRADAVLSWMVNQCGVDAKNLIAKGYGESQPVNGCKNLIRCSEEEHQLNRRTEFKIIGKRDNEQLQKSAPNDNPRVDPCPNCSF